MNADDLLSVSKPTRYIGGEINAVHKDGEGVALKFALAFPDVYEVGMSHLGLQILYHILNRQPEIVCERVFAPWPDMEKLLRSRSLPLTTLESSRPLKEFDLIGFSLLYELNYTGILNILDLSGIPLRASDRGENDPLIIGGGPCAMNPEPLADFFDAFVLGDGEEVVLEVCREILTSREKGELKETLLKRLSRLEGVYIPSFFRIEYERDGRIQKVIPLKPEYSTVARRVLPDLNQGDFPPHPVLPFMEIIHDRLNIEIARGCTRGCRFCQAGIIYRPLRERTPQKIWQMVETGLQGTGYDEISLLSLSTGDYSLIEPLLSSILARYQDEKVAVSLPSLRVETLTPDLISHIKAVRKTGFTLAPEAGTERLRRVINKGNTEEDLLSTIQAVFSAGWRLVKLYFMIGLPTETEEDLDGIVSLCRKAMKIARSNKGSAEMNVSISSFIPKAHTPFQWEPQCSMEEIQQKQKLLRRGLEGRGIRYKGSDFRLSQLEGIWARGDRRLSRVLEIAYKLGCRLDAWGEHFRYDLWEKAFSETGLEPSFYTLRPRAFDEILPWDHLDSRVSKAFLLEERNKAYKETPTTDCRNGSCNECGVCAGTQKLSNRQAGRGSFSGWEPFVHERAPLSVIPVRRFRSQFAKFGKARYFGHLELVQILIRAFRRAMIPIIFSQGFHPLPKVSFGPPLPVGYESWAEFLDYHIQGNFDPETATSALNHVLPNGLQVLKTQEISLKFPSIFDNIIRSLYKISFSLQESSWRDSADRFIQEEKVEFFWGRKNKFLDLKKIVEEFSFVDDHTLEIALRSTPEARLKVEEALDFIFGWEEGERPALTVQKIGVTFKEKESCPAKS